MEKPGNYQHRVLPCGKSQFHEEDFFWSVCKPGQKIEETGSAEILQNKV